VAGRGRFIVVKVVVPEQLFARGNIPQSKDPRAAFDLIDLAVGITGVIQVCAQSLAIDDGFAIFQTVKVGAGSSIVQPIGLFWGNARAIVLDNAGASRNRSVGKYSHGVNARRANYEGHAINFARLPTRGKPPERILPDGGNIPFVPENHRQTPHLTGSAREEFRAVLRGHVRLSRLPRITERSPRENMPSMRKVTAAAIAFLFSAIMLANAQTAKTKSSSPSAPESYCTSTGGVVEHRIPVYGTNGPMQNWLRLAGGEEFCQYTSSSDGSRIHISLETLYTTLPTLAALAYYAAEAWNGQGEGNPASLYCTQLGGSDQFGGSTGAGGGWVELHTIDETLEACIFPDNSTIDSWGLFYHSDGIIRGIDLSTVLRYANPYGDGADTEKNSERK
jgi:putative hemolysin